MANEVEQLLIDAQRVLNQRNLEHREQISNVMTGMELATVRYGERMDRISEAYRKLEQEKAEAFSELREAITHQGSTLILVRDMHPVLVEEKPGEPQKKITNGGRK